jgi:hypothetical protein
MTDPAARQLLDRIARYVGGESGERFDELARAAFTFQVERVGPVRALAGARGVTPEAVRSWRDVPPVPALAYKSLALHPAGLAVDGGEVEVFRSSGTSRGDEGSRSVHRHVFPALYRAVIDASFPRFCLPHSLAGRPAKVPMLSLIPPRDDAPESSLSFMIDYAMARWGEEGSTWAFGADGLDADAAGRWCRRAEEAGRPVLVLATAFALAIWLDALTGAGAASGDRVRLPAGSVLFETGGFKGRTRELSRPELLARVEERLGVPAGRIVREYGMTELTSQLYTRPGGDLFLPPPWARVRVLDPETLEEALPGDAGLIAVFDLANLSSAVHLLTEDLGAMEPLTGDGGHPDRPGLRLLGRAAGAELRGCSLTAEAMASRS